jgi:cold shock CspA family protein
MHGKVASVSPERGFGFITPDEEGGEVFFHRSALHGVEFEDLAAGVAVEFTLGHESGDQLREGLRAVDVRIADDAIPAIDHEVLPAEKLNPG